MLQYAVVVGGGDRRRSTRVPPCFRFHYSSSASFPTGTSRKLVFLSTKTNDHDSSFSTFQNNNNNEDNNDDDDDKGTKLKMMYQELQWLSNEIRRHDDLYYNHQAELDDDEYDALVRLEESIEDKYPQLVQQWMVESGLGVQATRRGRVGAKVEQQQPQQQQQPQKKQKHLFPMLSLDNVHTKAQLQTWLQRIPKAATTTTTTADTVTIITEPKLDGVSLSLRYEQQTNDSENYSLVWASTRGDGKQGLDVTAAILQLQDGAIPKTLSLRNQKTNNNNTNNNDSNDSNLLHSAAATSLEVRGEVVMPNTKFQELSAENNNITFSNARNAASGILMRKKEEEEEERDEESKHLRSLLQFYAYDLVANNNLSKDNQDNDTDNDHSFYSLDGLDNRKLLEEWGFQVPQPIVTTDLKLPIHEDPSESDWINDNHIASMLSYYNALEEYRTTTASDRNNSAAAATAATAQSSTTKQQRKSKDGFVWGDFDTDGCVHKISQPSIKQALGRSTKSPRWAVAHKFPPLAAVSNLLDVKIQVGRTGALTPVAILEPVEVGGVTIQRATLHNFGHLQQILLGGEKNDTGTESHSCGIPVGTPVLVRRAGDVIPQVVQRIENRGSNTDTAAPPPPPLPPTNDNGTSEVISLDPPTHCPACGSSVVWEEPSGNSVGQVIRCGGPPLLCPPRAITSLAHAYSRDALDVSGLSEARIEQLMEAEFLRFPCDVFQWSDEWNQIADELPGWGPKSSQNLKSSIQRVAKDGVSLGRFVFSLGVRHVGKHSSELVASSYGSVQAFLDAIDYAADWNDDSAALEERPFAVLEGRNGVGPVLIDSLVSFSKSKELVAAAKDLAQVVRVLEQPTIVEEGENSDDGGDASDQSVMPWKGLRVVFTGSMTKLTRSQAQDAAKQLLGAKSTPGSVSKSTSIVVFGDKGGKKLDQARALGIPTMPAEDFFRLIGENGFDFSELEEDSE